MLQEHTAKLAAHNETAVKLADHWRQEAHRQAAFAQAAGSPAMQVHSLPSAFVVSVYTGQGSTCGHTRLCGILVLLHVS